VATVLAFHAHPDDEVLLTGGTLAKLAHERNRVVIVVATDGIMGEASDRRLRELRASAAVLGAARVVHLGYADSGYGPLLFPDPPGRVRFARADLEEAAAKLAGIIREEHAELLLSYDASGGYGHRDHMKVHRVGARAAQLAGDVRVLEGTWPRELFGWLYWPVWLLRLVVRCGPRDIRSSGSPRAAITHSVNVRRFAAQKQAALLAHHSPNQPLAGPLPHPGPPNRNISDTSSVSILVAAVGHTFARRPEFSGCHRRPPARAPIVGNHRPPGQRLCVASGDQERCGGECRGRPGRAHQEGCGGRDRAHLVTAACETGLVGAMPARHAD
jgi:LmbE family N-acetylglucosaminyl deacetylase